MFAFRGKLGVLCFLETHVLRFSLLPYYRQNAKTKYFQTFTDPIYPFHTTGLFLYPLKTSKKKKMKKNIFSKILAELKDQPIVENSTLLLTHISPVLNFM